jgi:hypothetical protein
MRRIRRRFLVLPLVLGLILAVPASASACDGCTPGFWKNNTGAWAATGYSPAQTYGSVFGGAPAPYASMTLLDALSADGGSTGALVRHSTAALLNLAHPDVANPPGWDVGALITAVNTAFASPDMIESLKNTLEALNEAGCPLNADEAAA